MECSSGIDSTTEYLRHLNQKMMQYRVPVSGSFELTRSCNLKCIHCYLRKDLPGDGDVDAGLNSGQWKHAIDEICDAGCLFLLLTGGEIFVRNDFLDIYSYAKHKGLLVTLFTNGTLISDEIIDYFKEFPPYVVEITVYGATPDTYGRITGSKAAYSQCKTTINKLLKNQIRVKLKTILMEPNRHEFGDIQKMAKSYGVPFRSDACIFGRLDYGKTPLTYRVSPKTAVEMEMADEAHLKDWTDFFRRMRHIKAADTIYQCGAGMTHFHIDAYGNLQPCLISTRMKYNIFQNGGFMKGWRDLMPQVRGEKAGGDILLCNRCEKRSLCGYCPAFFALESGSELQRADYLCEMAKYRHEKIMNHISRGL